MNPEFVQSTGTVLAASVFVSTFWRIRMKVPLSVRALFMAVGMLWSAGVYHGLGPDRYIVGLCVSVPLMTLLNRRWCLGTELIVFLSVFWPFTAVLFYNIVRTQEESRRERIVREVMET